MKDHGKMCTDYKILYEHKIFKDGKIIDKAGKIKRPCNNGRGYLIITLRINNKRTSKAVHRLVAEAWIPNPDNYPEVNHIDCDRMNNHASNLEWCSHSYNVKYSYDTGNRNVAGINNANCKTDEHTVRSICELLSKGMKPSVIRDIGYDYGLVRKIKRRATWKNISKDYIW